MECDWRGCSKTALTKKVVLGDLEQNPCEMHFVQLLINEALTMIDWRRGADYSNRLYDEYIDSGMQYSYDDRDNWIRAEFMNGQLEGAE